jgi:hypothetical protein
MNQIPNIGRFLLCDACLTCLFGLKLFPLQTLARLAGSAVAFVIWVEQVFVLGLYVVFCLFFFHAVYGY